MYEVQFVPGLLQTEDYARAVIRLGHPRASDAEIERRVELRLARQALLTAAATPEAVGRGGRGRRCAARSAAPR